MYIYIYIHVYIYGMLQYVYVYIYICRSGAPNCFMIMYLESLGKMSEAFGYPSRTLKSASMMTLSPNRRGTEGQDYGYCGGPPARPLPRGGFICVGLSRAQELELQGFGPYSTCRGSVEGASDRKSHFRRRPKGGTLAVRTTNKAQPHHCSRIPERTRK